MNRPAGSLRVLGGSRIDAQPVNTRIDLLVDAVNSVEETAGTLSGDELTDHQWARLSDQRRRLAAVEAALSPPDDTVDIPPVRRVRAAAGSWITGAGAFLILFLAYQFLGSGLINAKGQTELLGDFKKALKAGGVAGTPKPGEVMGVLRIPALDLKTVLVEGTTPYNLEKGPGHMRGTPFPGKKGNMVVAGRRTTFGGPFSRLDDLKKGDIIHAASFGGSFKYKVVAKKIVKPGRPDAIGPSADGRLTLVTSHPAYSSGKRLAVMAKLQGGAPGASPAAGPFIVGESESGLAGDTSALGPLVLWLQALGA
ncbi:MAG: sortase, partial [Actinomycetota bacterium]